MIDIKRNCIMPSDYIDLRIRSGNKPCKELGAVRAMRDSLFTTGVYNDDQLIAFGRICGDGALQMLICDIMIDIRYEGKKLDAVIIKDIEDYIREFATNDTQIVVAVEPPMDKILAKFKFKYFDEDYIIPMWR